ncbi:hypothetical protein LCGC14_0520480 [marine sediment metagenome]|uniref:Uncharacterized protein n=1 Tax=marine sediment metagenome TaxID=412755 RepID=A0A0F9RYQ8_9ZZZZ
MRREQDSRIYFGHAEEWSLAREMVLAQETLGDDGVEDIFSEQYCFALNDDRMLMAPGELAELHEAIHEMLRMAEQHRDALTDGAEQQIPQPAHWGDPFKEGRLCGEMATNMATPSAAALTDGAGEPDPAPDEAELRGLDLAILRGLDEQGEALLSIGDDPGFVWESNDNRAPYTHHTLNTLAERGLVMFSSTFPSSAPNYKQRYRITSAGRARLDAQTPEAESEKPLSGTALDILRGMAGGRRLLDAIGSAFVTYEASGTSFSREPFVELRKRGLVCVAQDAGDGFCYYAISAEGEDFLADQAPS